MAHFSLEEQKVLTDRLDKASQLYYRGETSEFNDTEFDLKFKELQAIEKENNYVFPNSPTQRVGTDAENNFKKITHPIPMLTIENTYDDNGLQEWVDKMHTKYGVENFNVSVKYDGISCELHYKDGILIEASTRGDKNIGDDITKNVRTIKDIPLSIDIKGDFYVRGEILLPKSKLAAINEERTSNGEQPFANTRNACSGSIKQLDSKITAKRGLIFRAWDCFGGERNYDIDYMTYKFPILRNNGFICEKGSFPYFVIADKVVESVGDFKKHLDIMELDYDYDGVVIKVDDIKIQDKIGIKDTRAIEWGIARKWNEEYEVWTELQGVEWSVGKSGIVTPVGLLEPVECAGVTISNVTLHNAGFVEEYELHNGNDLRITRSGGVIPYVLEVKHDILMEMHNAHPKINIPEVCPVCGEKLVREGPLLKCINEECPAIVEGQILQFCSKDCCDIKTVGESIVHDLVENKLIGGIIDILCLGAKLSYDEEREVIKEIFLGRLGKGYGEKTIDNIFDGIVNARLHTPLEKVIAGLSIPNVGKVMARALCKKYKDVYGIQACTIEDLITIDGVAETTAKGIFDWVKNGGYELLYAIDDYGWNYSTWEVIEAKNSQDSENSAEDLPLKGLKVCFTGKSFKFKGDEVEQFLEKNGAEIGGVNKSLNYLIIGEKPGGSKVDKAKTLGIEIITEEDFYSKYKI